MPIRPLTCFLAGWLLLASAALAGAAPEGERPRWDQEKAVARVKAMLALEKSGQPWEKIAWETKLEHAVAKAQREDKPLFVYWYVDKGGPKASPC